MARSAACVLGFFLVLLSPLPAFAQPPPSGQNTPPTPGNLTTVPNDFPTPTQPWYGIPSPTKGNYGNVVRYIEVPPRQVAIPVYVPGPGSFSGGYEDQIVEIPGYVVTETTTGYLYPPRVDLQQVTPGAYQWVTLPQQFQPK
jgi:hypothetical protein